MVSGVEFSDESLIYNIHWSSQQSPSLMPIMHLAHPSIQHPSRDILFS